jgi:hypothetical protein
MFGHAVAADRGADRNEQNEPKADAGHRGAPRRSRNTSGLPRRAVDARARPIINLFVVVIPVVSRTEPVAADPQVVCVVFGVFFFSNA